MTCNKQNFNSKSDAIADCKARPANSSEYKRIRKLRPYLCPICDKWHLTSQNKKVQRAIGKKYQN